MEKLYSNLVGTPVLEDDNIRPLTSIKNLILDPESGKLVAIVVDAARNKIITPYDVIYWNEVIKINDKEHIISADEVIRVTEILNRGVSYIGNRVETEKGKYLGKVFDLSIDIKTFSLLKIYVSKSFLGLLRYEHRIIPAKNIIEVLPDKIIVKNDVKTVKEEVKRKVSIEDMAVSP